MENEVKTTAPAPVIKPEAVASHEKVLRLECLRLATSDRVSSDTADEILSDAEAFAEFVIGGAA